MVRLPIAEKKTLSICITVYTQYRRVPDRRTHISPRHRPIVRGMRTRGAVKTHNYCALVHNVTFNIIYV